VILATNRSAYALSFNLQTGIGDGTGTLTLTDLMYTDPKDGYSEYEVTAISGTFAGQTITGIEPGITTDADNYIEIDPNGNILTDQYGMGFDTSRDEFVVYTDKNGFAQPDILYEFSKPYASPQVTSFTETASTSTPVPFQAPLADAIPVIGSVLVLGALRKVRNFKKA
jgi:hypothetical protein